MKLLTNWRNYVLLALALLALVLLLGECDAQGLFEWLFSNAMAKAIGLACGYAYWRLFTYWDKRGQLPEIRAMFADL